MIGRMKREVPALRNIRACVFSVNDRVAASSAAWGWPSPASPKAYGLEAATLCSPVHNVTCYGTPVVCDASSNECHCERSEAISISKIEIAPACRAGILRNTWTIRSRVRSERLSFRPETRWNRGAVEKSGFGRKALCNCRPDFSAMLRSAPKDIGFGRVQHK